MAPPKKSNKPRRYRKAKAMRPRSNGNVAEMASLSVKRTILDAGATGTSTFQSNTMYSAENVSLSEFDRAINVAKAYQFYRIKNIRLTYKHAFDTFTANTTDLNLSIGRPNLYYQVDKAGVLGLATTLEQLKQMGSRPIAMDNKPTSVAWTPSVLTETDGGLGGALASQYKISPWLNTSSTTIPHRGLFWFLDQKVPLAPTPVQISYDVEIEVQFEFKKPLWQQAPVGLDGTRPVLVRGIKYATQDNSANGIDDGVA